MTKKKRQIIFLWPYLEWGGAQIYMMAIMKQALDEWDVIVALPRSSSPEVINLLEQIGVRLEFLDFVSDTKPAQTIGRKLQRQWNRIRTEFATLRFLSRFDLKDAILHVETSPWQSWQFLTLLAIRKANVFVTMHNAITGPKWREFIWKLRMQYVSRLPGFHIFASNQHTKDGIRHLVAPKFWDNVPVTYTCVDPEQIRGILSNGRDMAELRQLHGLKKNDFVVLCVGQFIDRKGRWVFLDAAKELEDDPKIKFVWVTPLEPDDADRKRVSEYGLSNFRLMLSSSIGSSREVVLEFFRIGDVFALPSYVEGLPIALLEAMALGITPISTNVYAIPEAVHDHETGLLIDAGDSEALSRAIVELKENDGLREGLSKAASELVIAGFDERVASRIAIDRYKECFDDAD